MRIERLHGQALLRTAAHTLSHFLVDFSCAFLLYRAGFPAEQRILILLSYNACAFALQAPLGLLTDLMDRNGLVAGTGVALIALSALLLQEPVALAVAAGLGNALFHLGGGRDVLMDSGERSGPVGLFVSTGALGLWLGGKAGRGGFPLWIVLALLAVDALLLCFLVGRSPRQGFRSLGPVLTEQRRPNALCLTALVALLLVILLRSYLGMTLRFSWKGEGAYALLLILATLLGKASGGYLADAFGAGRVCAASLSTACLLFLFGETPLCGLLAVLLFNMTMPLTLTAAARLLPKAKGFAFGLTTFALFLGLVPILLELPAPLQKPWGYALLTLVSLGLLWPALRTVQRRG